MRNISRRLPASLKQHFTDIIAWLAVASACVLLLASTSLSAAPINPLTDVHSASPTDTVLIDTASYGNGTGAGGNVLSDTWFASTNKNGTGGFLLQYDGKTFQQAINMGMPLSGVDVNPDGSLIVSSGSSLYHGRIVGGAWQGDSSIDLGSHTINDVCTGYGMADYFVAASDGVFAVRNGALGESVDGSIVNSIKYFELDSSKYSPTGLSFLQGNISNTVTDTGLTIDGFNNNLNNYSYPTGDAQLKDFRVLVEPAGQNSIMQFYNNDTYASGIVPEPATIGIMVVGALLITRRKAPK